MIAKIKSVTAIGWKPGYGEWSGRQIQWFALFVFTLFFLLSLFRAGSYTLDESLYHYPNLINFYENGVGAIFNVRYSAANTPLPYIIVAAIAKITSPNLVVARVVTGIFSLCAFLIAVRLLKRHGADSHNYFVLLFYPYFFLNSFVFYAVNYGLFFALLALLVLDTKKQGYLVSFIAGILLSLAVLCQQFYLVVPAAIAFSRTVMIFRQKEETFTTQLLQTSVANLLLVLPLAVPVLLFIKWKGLTHPNFYADSLSFFPSTVTAILFVTGFLFTPYLVQSYEKIGRRNLIVSLAAAVLLVCLFRPIFSVDDQGPGLFTGITYHLLSMAGVVSPWITYLLMVCLTAFGILFFRLLADSLTSAWDYALFTACIFLSIAYASISHIGERHLLALIIFLFLLALPRIGRPFATYYAAAMAMLGVCYFFYWTFLKFGAA